MTKENKIAKCHIKKGDRVLVLSGAYRGKEGEVLEVIPKKYRAVVEGVNEGVKHAKPTQKDAGGLKEINRPIHISNLMLIDPSNGEPTRVKRELVDGRLKRVSKKSGEIID